MILNLADPGASRIKYELIGYSDSHTHIDLERNALIADSIVIKTRISCLDDLFLLLQATEQVRLANPKVTINLVISYLLCGRYDRPMHEGDSFDLKLITDLISDHKYGTITVMEPHSQITTALLRARAVHPLDDHIVHMLAEHAIVRDGVCAYHDWCICSPDIGAIKRVEDLAKKLPYPISLVHAHKERDLKTGSIKRIGIMNVGNVRKNVLIYDDLCDGGRTFTELAKVIDEESNIKTEKTLACTHGIFSKGVNQLLDNGIDKIITTNSYKEWSMAAFKNVQIVKVI